MNCFAELADRAQEIPRGQPGSTAQQKNQATCIDATTMPAFEPQIDFSVQRAGGLKSMIFGGEGLFLATLRGTGRVWIQSMPVRKLIQALMPRGANAGKENGSVLGGLGRMFE